MTRGVVAGGVNLAGGVDVSSNLAGRFSKTESHDSGRGGPRLAGGVEFSTCQGNPFMILPLRRAQNVKPRWLDLKNRIQGFWQGGSAAGRGGQEIQNPSRWELKNRLAAPCHYPDSHSK